MGAVPLVKQMAEDLAQRDAQITLLQRRAGERERLLRKMLRECDVSNLKIENRLKELEEEQLAQRQNPKTTRSADNGRPSLQSENSIGEQITEAFAEMLSGHETRPGDTEPHLVSKGDSTSATTPGRRVSAELSRHNSATIRKKSTSRGWRGFFSGQNNDNENQSTVRTPLNRTVSAQERLLRIHTASQANLKKRGLTTSTFKASNEHYSGMSSRKSSVADNKADKVTTSANDASDAASSKSANSLASWATRLVGGKATSQDPKINEKTLSTQVKPRSRASSGAQKKTVMDNDASKPTVNTSNAVESKNGTYLNTSVNQTRNDARSPLAAAASASPLETNTRPAVTPGPMEMDTILPGHSRPPTLIPYEAQAGSAEILTDRYGFIYDQRRRLRQNVLTHNRDRSKRGSRVETLENHRRSWASLPTGEGDTASIRSQRSGEILDASQSSPIAADVTAETQAPKRWQDYLKISGLSTELLSHTPSVAPTTNIITGNDATDDTRQPQIKVSRHGSIIAPSSTPSPAPSQVISGDAEFAQAAENGGDATAVSEEMQSVDAVKVLLDQLTDIHDASQREKEARWKDFLKKVGADRRRQGEAHTNERRAKNLNALPEASWMDGEIIGVTSLGNEGKAGRAKWLEFKNLLLGGIPISLRPKVWAECSGALSSRVPGYYDEMVRTTSHDEVIVQQIAMDIPRTLTDNIYFRQGDGMAKLSEVLLAYSLRNPEVGYCQGMNLITANLLLIMPTAEDAFWMLATLIERILPDKYYDHSLLTSRADQAVLRQYVGTVLPNLSAHLENLSVDLEALTFQWFLSVFTDCLSAEALFRVWDVMLCTPADAGGGAIFLFEVALALLKLNEKQLLTCESPAEVYAYINGRMTDHAISIDGLIRASEALRKVVKREEVEKKRSAVVQADLELMRQRDAVRKGKAKANAPADTQDDGGVGAEAARSPTLSKEETRSTTNEDMAQPVRDGVQDNRFLKDDLMPVTPMPVEEELAWRG
ncbi:MAG: hypothetical protein Q9162_000165 [Coniocarpon cinnabarinum]